MNGRGHWLASVMLGGSSRKEPDLVDTQLFDRERKRSKGDLRGPDFSGKVPAGKKIINLGDEA